MAAATSNPAISQEEDCEDRLSDLPDDVLISILERLNSFRDTARCSILSRRWRRIPSMLAAIVLDVESFNPTTTNGSRSKPKVTIPARHNKALAKAAETVLRGRKSGGGIPIACLALALYLSNKHECTRIVGAVGAAMSSGLVAEAKLRFLGEKTNLLCDYGDIARHGKCFATCFAACPRAFAGLTGLHVESARLRKSGVPDVLRACRKLRRLSLDNCHCGEWTVLRLEHPELAELELELCDPVDLRCLPKLAQVTVRSWVPSHRENDDAYPLWFGHVPRLRRLVLSTAAYVPRYPNILLSKLLANCTTLRELSLNFESYRIWVQPEGPQRLAPLLQNLSILNLEKNHEECDLAWTLFPLQAAPLLKMLRIQVLSHICASNVRSDLARRNCICDKKHANMTWEGLSADFTHQNLVRLEVCGFQPDSKFMEYVRRAVMAAVNLEAIALTDKS